MTIAAPARPRTARRRPRDDRAPCWLAGPASVLAAAGNGAAPRLAGSGAGPAPPGGKGPRPVLAGKEPGPAPGGKKPGPAPGAKGRWRAPGRTTPGRAPGGKRSGPVSGAKEPGPASAGNCAVPTPSAGGAGEAGQQAARSPPGRERHRREPGRVGPRGRRGGVGGGENRDGAGREPGRVGPRGWPGATGVRENRGGGREDRVRAGRVRAGGGRASLGQANSGRVGGGARHAAAVGGRVHEQLAGGGRVRPPGRVLAHQGPDHGSQRPGRRGRWRVRVHDAGQHRHRLAVAIERPAPLHGRIQRGAERPQVGRRGGGLAADAFGGAEPWGSHDHARLGQRRVAVHGGDTEIGQHRPPLAGDEHVARLDIAMHDPCRVGAGQRPEQHHPGLGGTLGRQRAVLGQHLVKRTRGNQFHHDPRGAARPRPRHRR